MARLRPLLETLEGRDVLAPTWTGPWEIAFIASQPSFRNDAQAMHDLHAFSADEKTGVRDVKGLLHHGEISAIMRDVRAIAWAMSGHGKDPKALAPLTSDPKFLTVNLLDPSGEAQLRATLEAQHVPAPLVDRLLADRLVLIDAFRGSGTTLAQRFGGDELALRGDAVRTGTISTGDPAYEGLTQLFANRTATLNIHTNGNPGRGGARA